MNVALIWRSIMVASNLSWTPHISMIAARAKKVAAWVHSAFKTRDKFTMMTLFKSLVRSHLEYCCPLWNPQRGSGVKLLEGVQRTFTAKICSVQHLDYWQRLKSLHLLSLQRRRQRYIIIHVWKILHGKCTNGAGIKFNNTLRRGQQALVPTLTKLSSQRNQTLYDQSLAVIASRLWNMVPPNLHSIENLDNFKSHLTDFLKKFPDEPQVPGYSSRTGNSLLEWSAYKTAGGQHF